MKNISQSIKCIVKSSTCEKKNPKKDKKKRKKKQKNVPQKNFSTTRRTQYQPTFFSFLPFPNLKFA